MNNFIYSIPTKIFFGEGQIKNLGHEVKKYADKVLLLYGGGSIKKNGIYDDVVKQLNDNAVEFVELAGVEPNPRIQTVRKGVDLCRKENVKLVLAVGGGSTIDCAKAIAGATKYDGDAWDIVLDGRKIKDSLYVASVLTLAATGSEMDVAAVISDMTKNDKIGFKSELVRPVFSVMDPTYTYSVSKYQTAAGSADIISHILESYFSNVNTYMNARNCEALLKTVIEFAPIAIKEPTNYEARANLMWASSWAINDFIKLGNEVNWTVHPIEHQLSAYYDITHGVGLAIITPHWMRAVLSDITVKKFCEFAHNVWDIPYIEDKFKMANDGIDRMEEYFKSLDIPMTLREVGIDKENFDIMATKAAKSMVNNYVELTKEQILEIFEKAL